jgi:hypothetical protein
MRYAGVCKERFTQLDLHDDKMVVFLILFSFLVTFSPTLVFPAQLFCFPQLGAVSFAFTQTY